MGEASITLLSLVYTAFARHLCASKLALSVWAHLSILPESVSLSYRVLHCLSPLICTTLFSLEILSTLYRLFSIVACLCCALSLTSTYYTLDEWEGIATLSGRQIAHLYSLAILLVTGACALVYHPIVVVRRRSIVCTLSLAPALSSLYTLMLMSHSCIAYNLCLSAPPYSVSRQLCVFIA